jgi:hypothetical protein
MGLRAYEKQNPRVHRSKREGMEMSGVACGGSTQSVRSRPTGSVGAGDYFPDWNWRRGERNALTGLKTDRMICEDSTNHELAEECGTLGHLSRHFFAE